MKELGEYLQNARVEQKISLQDIQNQTKIRSCYLEALEKGDFDAIPGEVYVKGFLTNYATVVGLDVKEVLDRYHKLKNEQISVAVETPPSLPEDTPSKTAIFFNELVDSLKQIQLSPRVIQYIIAGGIGFGLLIGFIFILTTKPGEIATEAPAVVVDSQVEMSQTETPVSPPVAKTADLRIKATEVVWISLKERDTGTIIEEVNLQPGEAREWEIERPLVLRIGNAGGLQISLRGGDYAALGRSGEVVSETYEPNP